MSFLDRFRSKKEDDASRISRLLKTGRMVDGRILDALYDNAGNITVITFSYTLAGVQYESSQVLTAEQQADSNKYAPGRQIIVRYDRQKPANSIVV